jgi:hypothetical protein
MGSIDVTKWRSSLFVTPTQSDDLAVFAGTHAGRDGNARKHPPGTGAMHFVCGFFADSRLFPSCVDFSQILDFVTKQVRDQSWAVVDAEGMDEEGNDQASATMMGMVLRSR